MRRWAVNKPSAERMVSLSNSRFKIARSFVREPSSAWVSRTRCTAAVEEDKKEKANVI